MSNSRNNELSGSRIEPRWESVAQPDFGTVRPFTSMPRRNLIYHVWPVRGAMWQWNLDQLKRRVDMFNGRRILGIVHDDKSVLPEEVQEFVAGHGFEFVIAKNNAELGEVVTFPLMMEKVKSLDPNEITFYGHAKGVKSEPSVPLPVMRWAKALYGGTLDDWLTIREQLQRFAMTGCFKRYVAISPTKTWQIGTTAARTFGCAMHMSSVGIMLFWANFMVAWKHGPASSSVRRKRAAC